MGPGDFLGNGEQEGASLANLGFQPDLAPVGLHNPLADGEAGPRAFVVLAAAQALEDLEYLLVILFVDADAVIADGEGVDAVIFVAGDLDDRLGLIVELDWSAPKVSTRDYDSPPVE